MLLLIPKEEGSEQKELNIPRYVEPATIVHIQENKIARERKVALYILKEDVQLIDSSCICTQNSTPLKSNQKRPGSVQPKIKTTLPHRNLLIVARLEWVDSHRHHAGSLSCDDSGNKNKGPPRHKFAKPNTNGCHRCMDPYNQQNFA